MPAVRIENSNNFQIVRGSFHGPGHGTAIEVVNSSGSMSENRFSGYDKAVEISGGDVQAQHNSAERITAPAIPDRSSGARVGWTPSSGPAMPVHCTRCDTVFPSSAYTIFNGKFYGINNREQCLVCGDRNALLAPGIFDAVEGMVRMVSANPHAAEMFLRLAQVSRDFLSGDVTLEDLQDQLNRLGVDVKEVKERLPRVTWLVIAVSALLATYSFISDTISLATAADEFSKLGIQVSPGTDWRSVFNFVFRTDS